MAVKALAVLTGNSAQVAAGITAEAEAAGLTASQRHGADTCVHYLTSKHEFLRYDQALAAGWPIATGVIEGYLGFEQVFSAFQQVSPSRTRL